MCVKALFTVLLLVALMQPGAAQVAGLGRSKTADQAQPIEDPLHRGTPRGTMAEFMRAVEREDFVAAARYMQLTDYQSRSTESLARDLKSLMDRYFDQALTSISDTPTGALDDGLAMDRERVGPLIIAGRKAVIELVRVTDPEAGPIWLISSETLARIPLLHNLITESWIDRVTPRPLENRELFGISLGYWIVLVASLLIPFVLLMLFAAFANLLVTRLISDVARRHRLQEWSNAIRLPASVCVALTIQVLSMRFLAFPLTFRIAYVRFALVLAVIAFTWLARRLFTVGFARARSLVYGKDRTSTQSLLLLGERAMKVVVIVVAIILILMIVGVDTKTALTGLGIGGVALALGAQKTVENLLGGIFLLSDRALAVGDFCSISNHVGTVEDVTLRSVRLRTPDNTLVSMPAGVLAQGGIENFATRTKILAKTVLRLRHGTSVDRLKGILDQVRTLLNAHPKVERESARICLINFGAEAIELELFAYVLTADFAEFLAVREQLLLETAGIVEAAGSAFAMPTQFIYADEKAAAAADQSGRVAATVVGTQQQRAI